MPLPPRRFPTYVVLLRELLMGLAVSDRHLEALLALSMVAAAALVIALALLVVLR